MTIFAQKPLTHPPIDQDELKKFSNFSATPYQSESTFSWLATSVFWVIVVFMDVLKEERQVDS